MNLSLAIGAAFFVNEPIIVSGSNGKELLIGDDVANSLIGAANGETIIGGTGDDFLAGNGGDDKLHGGDGEDDLDGGLGNDKIWGDFDNDSLTGGDGADELYGGPGNDILKGDAGDDYLFGGVGNDTLIGGSGADVLDGGTDSNGLDQDTADYSQDTSATAGITVTAGAQAGETSVAAGGATDTLTAIEIIKGTAANDTFKGAAQGVTFDGGGGLNTADFSLTASVQATGITGGGYNVVAGGVAYTLKSIQTFIGTEGKDEFGAQGEAVTFWGEGGDDTLLGSTQNDILLGGDGNDTLFGAAGDDLLGGGYGRDIFLIGQGHDEIVWLSREDFVSTGTRTSVSSWSMDTWGGNPISGGDFLDNPEAAASRMGWSVKDKGSGWVLLEDQANPNNTVKINGKFKKDDDPNGNNPSTPPSGEIDLPDPQPAEGSFGLVDAGPAGMGDNGAGGLPGSNVSSPLVIDLDGDGIELITLSQSRAFFDLEGDGMAQHTGWVAPDDALLAIDRNNNGTIDDGTELFGNTNGFEEGFRALSEYDSNLDGVIDADDQAFGQFLLWQDLDGDGRVSDGELSTAASRGLTSIPLNFTATNYTLNEALISGEANVTWASSGQTKIVDAWFSFSAANAFSSSTTSVAVSDSE
ncbi:MAG: hypothetical protein KDA47_14415, partial [Planctomycetales bacterium]|nr:hypothetical protein [Planctomycetales bacterium]